MESFLSVKCLCMAQISLFCLFSDFFVSLRNSFCFEINIIVSALSTHGYSFKTWNFVMEIMYGNDLLVEVQ